MTAACLLIQKTPFFPQDHGKSTALKRLLILMTCGGAVYIAACSVLRIGVIEHLLPKRNRG